LAILFSPLSLAIAETANWKTPEEVKKAHPRFNDAGLIESVRAEARGAMVGSEVVMMPWECSRPRMRASWLNRRDEPLYDLR